MGGRFNKSPFCIYKNKIKKYIVHSPAAKFHFLMANICQASGGGLYRAMDNSVANFGGQLGGFQTEGEEDFGQVSESFVCRKFCTAVAYIYIYIYIYIIWLGL